MTARRVVIEKVSESEQGAVYHLEAIHPTITRNKRKYTKEELVLAARSLSYRPVNIDHDTKKWLSYDPYEPVSPNSNCTQRMKFDSAKDAVIGDIWLTDRQTREDVDAGRIKTVSIEAEAEPEDKCDYEACYSEQHEVIFTGIGLLQTFKGVQPGDPKARISKEAKAKEAAPELKATVESEITSVAEQEDGSLKIKGVLAVPRVNLNGSLLLPQELAKGAGLTIPLSINHRYSFDPSIAPDGSINLIWNNDMIQLEYEGVVTSTEGIEGVKSGKFKHTSISIMFADFDFVYGFFVLKDILAFIEGSLVENPAIPEATVVINEKLAGMTDTDRILRTIVTEKLALKRKEEAKPVAPQTLKEKKQEESCGCQNKEQDRMRREFLDAVEKETIKLVSQN